MSAKIEQNWQRYRRDVLEKSGISHLLNDTMLDMFRLVFYAGSAHLLGDMLKAFQEDNSQIIPDLIGELKAHDKECEERIELGEKMRSQLAN